MVVAGSSVSALAVAVVAASGCGNGVVLKQAEGKEKMEKERRRCSTAEEALGVTPDPRRGDGSGGRALERTATAATTAFTRRNHNALELSHAGSGAHHHSGAIICGWPAGRAPTGSRTLSTSRARFSWAVLALLRITPKKLCAPS